MNRLLGKVPVALEAQKAEAAKDLTTHNFVVSEGNKRQFFL
jgi:hypothetical protein